MRSVDGGVAQFGTKQNRCTRMINYGFIFACNWVQYDGLFLQIDVGVYWRQMNSCRLHVFYSGRVQGVGFRYTVKEVATGFEVTGLVRNLLDGRVELVAEGVRSELEAFQQAIRDSGLACFIRHEETHWETAEGNLRGFQIAG